MKMLGVCDDQNTCDKCGKKNLKRTIALQVDDAGNVEYWGSDCAARVLYGKSTKSGKDAALRFAYACGRVQKLRDKGMSAKDIANQIWNIYGFLTGHNGDDVYIGFNNATHKV